MGTEFRVCRTKSPEGGWWWMHIDVHLMAEMMHFMLYVFYHDFKIHTHNLQ